MLTLLIRLTLPTQSADRGRLQFSPEPIRFCQDFVVNPSFCCQTLKTVPFSAAVSCQLPTSTLFTSSFHQNQLCNGSFQRAHQESADHIHSYFQLDLLFTLSPSPACRLTPVKWWRLRTCISFTLSAASNHNLKTLTRSFTSYTWVYSVKRQEWSQWQFTPASKCFNL